MAKMTINGGDAKESKARKLHKRTVGALSANHAKKFGPKPLKTVQFGVVTVTGEAPSAAVVKASIRQGTDALDRALTAIVTPGVKLKHKAGMPLYAADPKNPNLLIRQLGGKSERGRFESGKFVKL
ncbi:MAG: hypothetical protein HOP13_13895 [Alphaproteobacteria bacterium]|nr:hypothetical protein [Alphaproteobacteria bacterium]